MAETPDDGFSDERKLLAACWDALEAQAQQIQDLTKAMHEQAEALLGAAEGWTKLEEAMNALAALHGMKLAKEPDGSETVCFDAEIMLSHDSDDAGNLIGWLTVLETAKHVHNEKNETIVPGYDDDMYMAPDNLWRPKWVFGHRKEVGE